MRCLLDRNCRFVKQEILMDFFVFIGKPNTTLAGSIPWLIFWFHSGTASVYKPAPNPDIARPWGVQWQGIQGRSRSDLLQILDNAAIGGLRERPQGENFSHFINRFQDTNCLLGKLEQTPINNLTWLSAKLELFGSGCLVFSFYQAKLVLKAL